MLRFLIAISAVTAVDVELSISSCSARSCDDHSSLDTVALLQTHHKTLSWKGAKGFDGEDSGASPVLASQGRLSSPSQHLKYLVMHDDGQHAPTAHRASDNNEYTPKAHNELQAGQFPKLEVGSGDVIQIALFSTVLVAVALYGVFDSSALLKHTKHKEASSAKPLCGSQSTISRGTCSSLKGPSLPQLHNALAKGGGVVQLIQEKSAEQPNKIALVDGRDGDTFSYQELWICVSALTKLLVEAGIGKQDVIANFLQASPELVIVALGVNNADAAWLPLDPQMPSARHRCLLQESGARLGLHSSKGSALDLGDIPLWRIGSRGVVNMKVPGALPPPLPVQRALPTVPPGTAHIIYTSGSTGTPKGVLYGMDTVLHGVLSFIQLVDADSSTLALLKCPSIWGPIAYEIYPALVAGGTIFCDAQSHKDLPRLSRMLADHPISIVNSCAPILKALVDEVWAKSPALLTSTSKSLRHICNIGGSLPLDCCASLHEILPDTSIHNMYGCTECPCTVWTYQPCLNNTKGSPNAPAGVPQPCLDIHILDSELHPVAVGTVGEVICSSSFNAYGYLGDPALTQEKFLRFGDGNLTMYRTGDLGRLIQDPLGQDRLVLELTGRADRQLNMNGIRMAPEEIEAIIFEVPGVTEVSVVGTGGAIVAFYTGNEGPLEMSMPGLAQLIRGQCTQHLPVSMRPHYIVNLKVMPTLPNGKVDLRALVVQATDIVSEQLVEVVDSLGQMTRVAKDVQLQSTAFAVARGLAMLTIILFHWCWWDRYDRHPESFLDPPRIPLDERVPSWLLWWLVGNFTSEWSLFAFVLMSGYTDRQAADEGKPGFWREVFLVIIIFQACFWPIPQIFQLVSNSVGDGTTFRLKSERHNWYLLLWLVCRFFSHFIFSPLEMALRKTSHKVHQLARLLIIAPFLALHMCAFTDPFSNMVSKFPYIDRAAWQVVLSCFIDKRGSALLLTYVAVWWFGQDIGGTFGKLFPSSAQNAPVCSSVSAALLCFVFILLVEYVGYHNCLTVHESLRTRVESEAMTLARDILLALLLIGIALLASRGSFVKWCGLATIGQYSLGGYVTHYFFMRFSADGSYGLYGFKAIGIPDIWHTLDLVRPLAGGFGQLVVLTMYAVTFLLTFGLVFQKVCLSFFMAVERGFVRAFEQICSARGH